MNNVPVMFLAHFHASPYHTHTVPLLTQSWLSVDRRSAMYERAYSFSRALSSLHHVLDV